MEATNLKIIFFHKKMKQLIVFAILFILIMVPFNLAGQKNIDRADNVFFTSLESGWNLVSLRYDATVYKQNLTVNYDGINYTWADAVSAGLVSNFIYKWNAVVQMYTFADSTDPSLGYWIFAHEPCQLWGDINVTVVGIDGGGTAGYIPKFTDVTTVGNSIIYESTEGDIGIGNIPPGNAKLYIMTNVSEFKHGLYTESPKGIKSISNALAGTGITGNGGHAGVKGEGGYIGVLGQGYYGGWFEGIGYFSGNVGIGTSSPNSKLEVDGTVHSTSGGFKFPDGSLQTTAGIGGITFESGTVSHGGTIPLPSGYTQEQCTWIVSISTLDTFDGGLNQRDQRVLCFADSNRVVTCKLQSYDSGWIDNVYGTANYLIMGIK